MAKLVECQLVDLYTSQRSEQELYIYVTLAIFPLSLELIVQKSFEAFVKTCATSGVNPLNEKSRLVRLEANISFNNGCKWSAGVQKLAITILQCIKKEFHRT